MTTHTRRLSITAIILLFALAPLRSLAFLPSLQTTTTTATDRSSLEYVSPDLTGVQEAACLETGRRMQRVPVPVPTTISKTGTVDISFSYWPASKQSQSSSLDYPLVLIHGFDSSCLEYRRLGSRLAAEGIDTYAVDLLGWGFTQLEEVESFSAEAKVTALNSFLETTLGGGKFCLAGASLGGAAAIQVAATNPQCAGLVLIDAQGFVDGIGPMSFLPQPVAQLGVQVLKSVPLRSSANQMSYFDKETFATDEAVVIGRLHCLREGWNNALVSFMQSGGFAPSTQLAQITCPSLILWGRQDGILEGPEFAPKFLQALADAELEWIEECGHVPHLEKPDETTAAMVRFLTTRVQPERRTTTSSLVGTTSGWIGLASVGATAAVLADQWTF